MPDFLIRDIDGEVLEKLKARARRNSRSLQSEIRIVLESAVTSSDFLTDAGPARKIKNSFRGRKHTDSAELLREDRAR